jgi:hypothetical protein
LCNNFCNNCNNSPPRRRRRRRRRRKRRREGQGGEVVGELVVAEGKELGEENDSVTWVPCVSEHDSVERVRGVFPGRRNMRSSR